LQPVINNVIFFTAGLSHDGIQGFDAGVYIFENTLPFQEANYIEEKKRGQKMKMSQIKPKKA
jgi:hypothetical protein